MELKGTKINFLGDSITEGAGASRHENAYCMVIEREYEAICQNYGICGTRIAKQHTPSDNPRFDMDFCSRVEDMDADADIVVVFGGTNDFGHGDAPLGSMSDRTPDTFYGALHTLYTELLEKFPESPIVVITPLHRLNEDNPRGDSNKPQNVGTLKTYVEIIREVAEYYSLPLLDLYKESGLQPNVPITNEKYFVDGLHPNDEGHKILARKIANFLQML